MNVSEFTIRPTGNENEVNVTRKDGQSFPVSFSHIPVVSICFAEYRAAMDFVSALEKTKEHTSVCNFLKHGENQGPCNC